MRGRLPRTKWNHQHRFIDLSVFKQRTSAVYSIGTFFVAWGLFAPWDYLPSMSFRHKVSQDLAVYTIIILKYVTLNSAEMLFNELI
jgi:hypothetical protein